MSIQKVREYFKQFGIEDRIREFDVSSATVELAAVAVGVEGARIAKSMSFKVGEEPIIIVVAGDTPPDFADAERMVRRLLPIDSISFFTFSLAPVPTASIIITALTPIIMPKLVSIERILFILSDTIAIFTVDLKSIILTLF